MSAMMIESVAEIARPAEAAQELARLNNRLARERTIPVEIAEAVHALATGVVEETQMQRWQAIDPYLALIIHRAVIQAAEAVHRVDEPQARDQLRVALESLRHGFSAIAESEPLSDEQPPKELVRWLADTTEVSQRRLADLLGVSLRQCQRWLSSQDTAQPEGEDARRLRAIVRIVNQLRFSLTPAGAVDWFSWPRDDLQGRRPEDLLDEPERLPELTAIAGSMRSTYAS
jgi:hypothetical protein